MSFQQCRFCHCVFDELFVFADERWKHIEKSLHRFVSLYPEFWYHCLEAFMVPLRVTLPPEADYSPYYLAHGR